MVIITNCRSVIYFLVLTVVGNFMLLNLFLAILLSNFTDIESPEFSWAAFKATVADLLGLAQGGSRVAPAPAPRVQTMAQTREFSIASANMQNDGAQEAPPKPVPLLRGDSLGVFGPTNVFRVGCQYIVEQSWFENLILFFIVISSVSLALDEPTLDPNSDLKRGLEIMEFIFIAIFTLELVLKVVVHGFASGPESYLRDPWNLLDAFIVATSWVSAFGDTDSLGVLRVLRTFRALRPLRTIKRAQGLKCVVETILGCLPAFINIMLVSSLVYLVFAIMGVQLWAGKFWYCNDDSVSKASECVGSYQSGVGVNGTRMWINAPMNFDDVTNGMLTLFEVASLELWLDVMHSAMDSPAEIGFQPSRNRVPGYALYFVVFIIIGCFLFLNLFVSAVVDNFNRIKKEDGHSATMTENQEKFVQSLRSMMHYAPSEKLAKPRGDRDSWSWQCRSWLFHVMQSNWSTGELVEGEEIPSFDNLIVFAIIANIIVMASVQWESPGFPTLVGSDELTQAQESDANLVLEQLNFAFAVLFMLEASVKIAALGGEQYFRSNMNTFDFGIVLMSAVGIILDYGVGTVSPAIKRQVTVIRALRIVRIFRLVQRIKGIRRLLETLLYTLPSLGNVAVLLALVLFMFTVLGMSFFGKHVPLGQGYYGLYNDHANFRSFWVGFFTLFRMSTGESWNGIMHDVMEVYPSAWVFFVTYMLFGSYLMFNLVIAILLEEFSSAAAQEQHLVTPDMIEQYTVAWGDLDPKATHFVPCDVLPMLLKRIAPPLGAGQDADAADVIQLLKELRVKQFKGTAHYIETFVALVLRAYKIQELDGYVYHQVVTQLVDSFPSIKAIDTIDEHEILQAVAARKMQALARGHRARNQMKQRREARRKLGGLKDGTSARRLP